MKFKTQLSDLNQALTRASIIKPKEDLSGISGFLMVARGETCFLYSEDEDSFQRTRVSIPITELEEEGSMILPSRAAAPLSVLEGEVTFTSKLEDGAHQVLYETSGGAEQTMPTLDARYLNSLDEDYEAAEKVSSFSPAVLRDALQQVKPFMPADSADPKVKDTHKCLQIMDDSKPEWAEGNGTAYGTTGSKSCYYYCDGLKGHGLSLHGLRVPLLLKFLSKTTEDITFKKSGTSSYFVTEDGNHVIGWSDSVTPHKKFDYYTLAGDTHILRLTQSVMVKNLEYIRKSLDPKQDRVRIQYDHEKGMIRIHAADNGATTVSPPIGVVPLSPEDGTEENPIVGGLKSKTEGFACNFSVNNLLDMIGPAKGYDVQLRVAPFPKRDGAFLFRTIEAYSINGDGKVVIPGNEEEDKVYQCQVTRFSLSRG